MWNAAFIFVASAVELEEPSFTFTSMLHFIQNF